MLPDRIADKIEVGDCWHWTAATNEEGYGRVWVDGKVRPAHRTVYQLLVGPIPEGLQLDHLCRTPRCVNPDHLEPVTQQENIRRGIQINGNTYKTHCKRGHEFTEENIINRRGARRECRTCARDQKRRRRAEAKANRNAR